MLRPEQEIFNELATFCTSPGYAHAIAYFCCRDTIVTYRDELTAKDLAPLYSMTRLVRTEISTLIGLMVRAPIDFTLPVPDVVQHYLNRTEELL
jgi:hypothetical protein